MLHDLFIDDFIHDLETFNGFLLCDANIGLLQRDWAETTGGKQNVRVNWPTPRDLLKN